MARGPAVEHPATVEDLAAVVRRAAEDGRGVRVVGRRHSYNDGFFSPTCMVSLDRLDRVLELDRERGTVTCEGGISIGAVGRYLDERGFALRYCGNFGQQTLAGALATGTHGYGREGGVMSELVRGATVVLADGRRVHTEDERDLRALRLGLGTLGALADITLAVERKGPCRFEVASLPREEFVERLDELARANEYLRFVTHPFDPRSTFYITINRAPQGAPSEPARYIDDRPPGALGLLVPVLRRPALRAVLGRALGVSGYGYSLSIPFSSLLFLSAGVVRDHPGLARVGQLALERNAWLNMELAVPRERYSAFARLFGDLQPRVSGLSTGQPYFTCRVVGAARSALLAPNYDRDVVFCDVHADPGAGDVPALPGGPRKGGRPGPGRAAPLGKGVLFRKRTSCAACTRRPTSPPSWRPSAASTRRGSSRTPIRGACWESDGGRRRRPWQRAAASDRPASGGAGRTRTGVPWRCPGAGRSR